MTNLPPSVLRDKPLVDQFDDSPSLILDVTGDGDTAMLLEIDPETGEIVRDRTAPTYTASALAAADYLGPRLTHARAIHAALVAERDVWQKRIADRFDAEIAFAARRVKWLEDGAGFGLWDTLRLYAEEAVKGGKARTLKLGLLKLSFRKKPARVAVTDEERAAQFLKMFCPDAVRTKVSVLTSLIPADLKAWWIAHPTELNETCDSGIIVEAESDTFSID